jgi:predicted O-methyltransferase YrrM/DNA-binding PadR family transcriptional regulator
MAKHRGGRGFQGFRGGHGGFGGHGDFGHRRLMRGRKIGADDLQLVLLLLLSEQPSHGYELIKALEQRSSGFYTPSPGMVYPALSYLEELLYTTVTVDGTRKLYHVAPDGRAYLEKHRANAEAVLRQIEQFGQRMAEFDESPRSRTRHDRTHDRTHHETPTPESPLTSSTLALDDKVRAVLTRLSEEAARNRPPDGGPRRSGSSDPFLYAQYGFSISPQQGDLIYLLCRAIRAQRVVEFATSLGVSTLYLAAAIRDNGGGTVIGSEIVMSKVVKALLNLKEAGLGKWVELRDGNARETLLNLDGPVDFALIDGWPTEQGPSLALQVLEIVAPQIRSGGLLMNDNAEPDYLSYVRDPRNGFVSIALPMKGSTELSMKL